MTTPTPLPKVAAIGILLFCAVDTYDIAANGGNLLLMVNLDGHGTPELAKAAKVSLQRRGDGGTGWSMAWKVNFWARLHDGNHAHLMLNNLIKKGGVNLSCQHPPFQIDGNFGGTSGIGEMLLQSHGGVIRLLPALPDAWPSCKVTGLRARGGYQVDFEWTDGKITDYRIRSKQPGEVKVSVNGETKTVAAETY